MTPEQSDREFIRDAKARLSRDVYGAARDAFNALALRPGIETRMTADEMASMVAAKAGELFEANVRRK